MTRSSLPSYAAFFQELERLGFVDGVNVNIERVTGRGREMEFDKIALELIERRPDVVFGGGTRTARALKRAGATMPIVGLTGDPIYNGIVESLARPEANITGFSVDPGAEFFGKHVQFLREALPEAKRMAYVTSRIFLKGPHMATDTVRAVAPKLGFELLEVPIDSPVNEGEFRKAFSMMEAANVEAAFFSSSGENRTFAPVIARLALEARLPIIGAHREIAESGGLMIYGYNRSDTFRRAAGYVAKILNGACVCDLPYQQPQEFEFIINLKTADALGLTMPPKLLIFATELID